MYRDNINIYWMDHHALLSTYSFLSTWVLKNKKTLHHFIILLIFFNFYISIIRSTSCILYWLFIFRNNILKYFFSSTNILWYSRSFSKYKLLNHYQPPRYRIQTVTQLIISWYKVVHRICTIKPHDDKLTLNTSGN